MEKISQLKIQFPDDKRSVSQCIQEFLDTTGGRDKFFRLFQYFAKFILPFIKGKEKLAKLAGFIESFGVMGGLARKLLRIGRYVNAYRSVMARLKKSPKDKDFNDIFRNISDISNALYFLLDHILLLNRMNFHKFDPIFINKVDFWSNFAWCIECITNLIYDLVDYYRNSLTINKYVEDIKKIDNADSKEFKELVERANKLKYEQLKKIIDMARCLFDIPLIVHFMTSDKTVSNKVAGFFGIVTSLIGCYQKWIK